MLVTVLSTACAILISIVAYIVVIRLVKNYFAHKFFDQRLPNLPVLPDANVFTGHAVSMYLSRLNWRNSYNLHKKYGESFGFYFIDRPVLNTIDPELIKTMVIDKPDVHINRPNLDIPMEEFTKDDIVFVEDDQWWRIRKAIAPAFSNHKVMASNVQDEIEGIISRFTSSLERKLESTFYNQNGVKSILLDADDSFGRYAVALVFSCIYKQDNLVDFDSEEDSYVKYIEEAAKSCLNPLALSCVVFPVLIHSVEWLITNFHVQGNMIRRIKDFIREQTVLGLRAKQELQMAKSKENSDNFIMNDGTIFRRNMMDHVIDQFHAGKLNENEYMNSTFFLFLAAAKTTADALSRLAYNLANHRDIQSRLRESIIADGVDSEYLLWCINESLRLFPPVNAGCSRKLSEDLDSKFGLIPAGTLVITPAFAIHRSEKYWGLDADEFKPERWSNSKHFHPVQFLAFGAGKRNCLGRDFALSAIKKLIVTMLHRYEFLPCPETNTDSILKFGAPLLIFMTSDEPTHVRLAHLNLNII